MCARAKVDRRLECGCWCGCCPNGVYEAMIDSPPTGLYVTLTEAITDPNWHERILEIVGGPEDR